MYELLAAVPVICESESVLNPLNPDCKESISKLKPSRRGYFGSLY